MTFKQAQPAEMEVTLCGFTGLEDRSVETDYLEYYTLMELSAHFIRNGRADYSSDTPLYYRVASLESRSGSTEELVFQLEI